MSANGFAVGFRERLGMRGAAAFGTALAGFVIAGQSFALASPGCTAMQGTLNSNTGPVDINGTAFSAGDVVRITYVVNNGIQIFLLDNGVGNLAGPQLTNITYTFPSNTNHFISAGIFAGPGQPANIATVTCTPAGSGNTNSQYLRALQVAATQTVAAISGQVIIGQVEDAIDDAFNNGTAPITPGPNGLHFNFAAEPQQDAATQEAFDALDYAANVYKALPSAPLIQRDWSVWADARGTGFDQNIAGGSANDKQINVTGGVARKLIPICKSASSPDMRTSISRRP
jgi:hypothetical protein